MVQCKEDILQYEIILLIIFSLKELIHAHQAEVTMSDQMFGVLALLWLVRTELCNETNFLLI